MWTSEGLLYHTEAPRVLDHQPRLKSIRGENGLILQVEGCVTSGRLCYKWMVVLQVEGQLVPVQNSIG